MPGATSCKKGMLQINLLLTLPFQRFLLNLVSSFLIQRDLELFMYLFVFSFQVRDAPAQIFKNISSLIIHSVLVMENLSWRQYFDRSFRGKPLGEHGHHDQSSPRSRTLC